MNINGENIFTLRYTVRVLELHFYIYLVDSVYIFYLVN